MVGQPLLIPGGNIFLLELQPWACLKSMWALGWWSRKRFPDLWVGLIRKGAHCGTMAPYKTVTCYLSWILSPRNPSFEVLTPRSSKCDCIIVSRLTIVGFFFYFTIMWKWYAFSRNGYLNFELWSFPNELYVLTYSLVMLDRSTQPQLPVSYTIMRVNNSFSTV